MTDTIESTGESTGDSRGAFVYQAQTADGQSITGTIDAGDIEQAQRLLAGLRLRVLEIERAAAREIPRGKALRADDFLAFNQQLAHLTSAGMPVEQGLRLIAQDTRDGLLAGTIRDLAAELERGMPMEQAFDKYRDRFPPLYSKLVGAGVSSGNLSGMLLNLGRHMELVQRLRAALWRATAYPLMVMVCVVLVVAFVSLHVIPRFEDVFKSFGTRLPGLTRAMLMLPLLMPWVLVAIAVAIVIAVVVWLSLKSAGREREVLEPFALRLPLVGPVMRYSLLARWSDAVSVGVHGGLDLPRAIELADEAVGSPALSADGRAIVTALQAGKPLEDVRNTRLLPATVVAAISLGSKRNDLPRALTTLSEMYQQQAQLRVALLPGVLTPILLIFTACIIGAIILGLFLPLISLIHNLTGWPHMVTLKGILEALFWMLMAAVCVVAAMVLIGWGAMPVFSYGGAFAVLLMFPVVLLMARVIRRRRGAAVLTYLEQAVRLNLPLPRMIDAARRSETGLLADRLGNLTRQLESGIALAPALRIAAPELGAGPPAMIEAAERLGRLPHALRRLVRQNSQKSAADTSDAIFIRAYPFIMTFTMAIAVSFFAIFVIPKYEIIFKDFGIRLPEITIAVMRTADFLGPIALALSFILMLFWTGGSFWRIVRPVSVERALLHQLRDCLIWWTPLLHGLARDRGTADALDLIAEALRAGQPIDRATQEASRLRVNEVLRRRLGTWSKRLEAGDAIGDAARSAGMPHLLAEMLSTARSGDQAADVLDFLSRYYESRFSRLRVIIQAAGVPVMVLFFAILVAVIALGMFLPMVALIQTLSSGSMSHWRL